MKMFKLIPLLLAGSALAVAGGNQSQTMPTCCSIPVPVKACVGTMGTIQNTVGVHAQEIVNEGGPNDIMLFHIGALQNALVLDSNNEALFGANGGSHRGEIDGTIGSWQTVTWLPVPPTTINFPVSNTQGTIIPDVQSPSNGQADQNGNFVIYVGAGYAIPGACVGQGTGSIKLTLMQK